MFLKPKTKANVEDTCSFCDRKTSFYLLSIYYHHFIALLIKLSVLSTRSHTYTISTSVQWLYYFASMYCPPKWRIGFAKFNLFFIFLLQNISPWEIIIKCLVSVIIAIHLEAKSTQMSFFPSNRMLCECLNQNNAFNYYNYLQLLAVKGSRTHTILLFRVRCV